MSPEVCISDINGDIIRMDHYGNISYIVGVVIYDWKPKVVTMPTLSSLVPPVMTKLASWQLSVFNGHKWPVVCTNGMMRAAHYSNIIWRKIYILPRANFYLDSHINHTHLFQHFMNIRIIQMKFSTHPTDTSTGQEILKNWQKSLWIFRLME